MNNSKKIEHAIKLLETLDRSTDMSTYELEKLDQLVSLATNLGVSVKLENMPPLTVRKDGAVFQNGTRCYEEYGPYGKRILAMTFSGKMVRLPLKKVIAKAYLGDGTPNRLTFRNGDNRCYQVSNIGYQNLVTTHIRRYTREEIVDMCIELVKYHFNVTRTVRVMLTEGKVASLSVLYKIRNKIAYNDISDWYFNEKLELRRIPDELVGIVDPADYEWE